MCSSRIITSLLFSTLRYSISTLSPCLKSLVFDNWSKIKKSSRPLHCFLIPKFFKPKQASSLLSSYPLAPCRLSTRRWENRNSERRRLRHERSASCRIFRNILAPWLARFPIKKYWVRMSLRKIRERGAHEVIETENLV